MKSILLVMLKYPVPKEVKTRLGQTIGYEKAASVYRSFVDTIHRRLQTLKIPTCYCIATNKPLADYQEWLGKHHKFHTQIEGDLGQKIDQCIAEHIKQGYDKVMIIGTDSPNLPKHLYSLAFDKLTKHDIVLGPSEDGGYYMLGVTSKGYRSNVFKEITWSSEKVLRQTLSNIHTQHLNYSLLPKWYDIDTEHDLERMNRNK